MNRRAADVSAHAGSLLRLLGDLALELGDGRCKAQVVLLHDRLEGHLCIYVHMYVYILGRSCCSTIVWKATCVYMYIYICICIYVCIYLCIYVDIYMYV